jgi:GPH family glycoside/pentoside/hexuronide:cation symporter
MSKATIYETAIEDRISLFDKIIYGLGALCNQLLAAAIPVMAIILNLGLNMNPAWVGYILAIPRFVDAIVDPIMGFVTDHTKSRWGRRKPFIFLGALFSGLIFAFMWQTPANQSQIFYFWFFTIGSVLFYLAYTVYAAPFIALGYEMTPDFRERTSLMSMGNTIGQFAWTIAPWFYPIIYSSSMFSTPVEGAKHLAIWVGIFVAIIGVLPAIFLTERFFNIAKKEDTTAKPRVSGWVEAWTMFKKFFSGFGITLKNPQFLKLCAAMFFIFNGFQLIAVFGYYNIVYFLFGGDQGAGSKFAAWFFSFSSLTTSAIIPIVGWIASKIGKRNAFFVTTTLSIFGYILKWFCYNPAHPYLLFLSAPLISFGLGGLFTLVGSMMADVCDQDELENGQRREGMFGAVNWWLVKLGMTAALAMSGNLLNFSGFNVEIGPIQPTDTLFLMRAFEIGIPIITSVIAMLSVITYNISEQKAHDVRMALEERRGKAMA